jgi:hypothetical protein
MEEWSAHPIKELTVNQNGGQVLACSKNKRIINLWLSWVRWIQSFLLISMRRNSLGCAWDLIL